MLLAQALVLLPLVHWFLKFIGYGSLIHLIERQIRLNETQRNIIDVDSFQTAKSVARIVSIAARHGIYRATCLRKSLVLILLLRRWGIVSDLCFGTRLNEHALEAHAWVELDGKVINDHPDIRQQYTPMENWFPTTQVGL